MTTMTTELAPSLTQTPRASRRRPLARINRSAFFADLGYAPHPGQLEIHSDQHLRRVVACGVRWGKSTCAAMEGLTAAMEPRDRSVGWVVGPTYELADKVFREVQLLAYKHLSHHIVTMRDSDRKLVLRNMGGGTSEIRAKSADNPVSLLGEGLDWLVVDEASRLKPTIWESHLSQRLIDKEGWALLISTPKGKGWFHGLFRRGHGEDPNYKSWNQPSWSNPHLPIHLIEAERERLPERVFRQEYGAEFIEGSGSVFRNVRECATGAWEEPQAGMSYFAGLDLAKVEDYTVLVILTADHRVVFADRFHRIDWALQIQRVKEATDRYRRCPIYVDSTGAGEPIYEALRRAGLNVLPYKFTTPSKAALVDNLSLMFERKMLTLPTPSLWTEGIEELEDFEYSVTDSGHVKSSAPSGSHDDVVMALGLAAWHRRPSRPTPGIFTVDGSV